MGKSLPQFGLAVDFPCNAIFKKKSQTKAEEGPLCFHQFTQKQTNKKIETKTPSTQTLLIQLWAKANQNKTKKTL